MSVETERAGFMQAICENPDDDNARLVFADWLQENDDDVFCACDNGSVDTGGVTPWGEPISAKCEACDGKGTIPNGFKDRAEFIRLQIALHQFADGMHCTSCSASWCPTCGDCCCPDREESMDDPDCPLHSPMSNHDRYKQWEKRERELFAMAADSAMQGDESLWDILPDWRISGWSPNFLHLVNVKSPAQQLRVGLRRGFVDEVQCRLSELGEEREERCRKCSHPDWISFNRGYGPHQCPKCLDTVRIRQFAPSPWATAVVRALPVTRFRITDREPDKDTVLGWAVWYDRHQVPGANEPNALSSNLFTAMAEYEEVPCPPHIGKWYKTDELAHDALAIAACQLVRTTINGVR